MKKLIICLPYVLLAALILLLYREVTFQGLDLHLGEKVADVPLPNNLRGAYPYYEGFIETIQELGTLSPWSTIDGGTPAIGNPRIPMSGPVSLFLRFGRAGFGLAMNWHLVLEIIAASWGMFALLRLLGVTPFLSVAAALTYVCSTAATWGLSAYGHFFHLVSVPWSIWLMLTTPRRPRWATLLLLAGLWYLQITYGQPQMSLLAFAFMAVAVLWVFHAKGSRRKPAATLGWALLITVMLSAHFWFPIVEYARNVSPFAWNEIFGFERVSWRYLSNLVVPQIYWGRVPWWPVWERGWTVGEAYPAFIGPVFLAGSLFAVFQKRTEARRLGFLALGLTLVAFGRTPMLLVYPLVILGAMGLQAALKSRKEAFGFLLCLVAVAAVTGAIAWGLDGLVEGLYQEAHRRINRPSILQDLGAWKAKGRGEAYIAVTARFWFAIVYLVLATLGCLLFRKRRIAEGIFAFVVVLAVIDLALYQAHTRKRGTVSMKTPPKTLPAKKASDAELFQLSGGKCAQYEVDHHGPARQVFFLTNECTKPVTLTVRVPEYPWWRYRMNGKFISPIKIDDTHQKVTVYQGKHRLEVFCDPRVWRRGIFLSSLVFVLGMGLAIYLPKSSVR